MEDNIISSLPKIKIVNNNCYNLHIGWESSYWVVCYCRPNDRNCTLAHPSGFGQTVDEAIYNFINNMKSMANKIEHEDKTYKT